MPCHAMPCRAVPCHCRRRCRCCYRCRIQLLSVHIAVYIDGCHCAASWSMAFRAATAVFFSVCCFAYILLALSCCFSIACLVPQHDAMYCIWRKWNGPQQRGIVVLRFHKPHRAIQYVNRRIIMVCIFTVYSSSHRYILTRLFSCLLARSHTRIHVKGVVRSCALFTMWNSYCRFSLAISAHTNGLSGRLLWVVDRSHTSVGTILKTFGPITHLCDVKYYQATTKTLKEKKNIRRTI